jgi:hypothetical protein
LRCAQLVQLLALAERRCLQRERVDALDLAGRVVRIDLGPLDRGEVAALVEAGVPVAPEPAVMARIVELVQGNPFFALGLARAVSVRGQRSGPRQPELLGDGQHPPGELLARRKRKGGRAVGVLARYRRRPWGASSCPCRWPWGSAGWEAAVAPVGARNSAQAVDLLHRRRRKPGMIHRWHCG